MTIIVATDFSEPAVEACRVAAHLAHATKEPLEVVHVREGEERNTSIPFAETSEEDRLRAVTEDARKLGAVAMCTMLSGAVAPAIADAATLRHARWVVTGFLGRRFPARWLVGSSAEKLCKISRSPVLVVREPQRLISWLTHEAPLKVVVGVDLTTKDAALATFLARLRAIGPCHVTAFHLAWPPALHARFGIHGPMDLVSLEPEVEAAVVREVTDTFGSLPGEGAFRAVTQVGWGKVDDRVATFARENQADLVVVAAPDRGALETLWHGSVSRGVVHLSTTNVLCVPLPKNT
ncbi:MAG: universal stress protein [Polyangiaceae bacterium]